MNVALDILSRIHTIPTVPIVDCFQKIRQQVKCYLQLAGVMGKNECMQVRFVFFHISFSQVIHFYHTKIFLTRNDHSYNRFVMEMLSPDISQFHLKTDQFDVRCIQLY